jgi:hypothetical protein
MQHRRLERPAYETRKTNIGNRPRVLLQRRHHFDDSYLVVA